MDFTCFICRIPHLPSLGLQTTYSIIVRSVFGECECMCVCSCCRGCAGKFLSEHTCICVRISVAPHVLLRNATLETGFSEFGECACMCFFHVAEDTSGSSYRSTRAYAYVYLWRHTCFFVMQHLKQGTGKPDKKAPAMMTRSEEFTNVRYEDVIRTDTQCIFRPRPPNFNVGSRRCRGCFQH